jgi:hypothetical protein
VAHSSVTSSPVSVSMIEADGLDEVVGAADRVGRSVIDLRQDVGLAVVAAITVAGRIQQQAFAGVDEGCGWAWCGS